MTRELQHAMAEYEEARIRYRKAVLASLNGASNGEAIREAIQSFQRARADLQHCGGLAAGAASAPPRDESGPWSFVRKLLKAG